METPTLEREQFPSRWAAFTTALLVVAVPAGVFGAALFYWRWWALLLIPVLALGIAGFVSALRIGIDVDSDGLTIGGAGPVTRRIPWTQVRELGWRNVEVVGVEVVGAGPDDHPVTTRALTVRLPAEIVEVGATARLSEADVDRLLAALRAHAEPRGIPVSVSSYDLRPRTFGFGETHAEMS